MEKYIEYTFNEKTYKMEYDRAAIVLMENEGLDIVNIASKPYGSAEILVHGALQKNYSTSWKEGVKIAEAMINEYGLMDIIECFTELYQDVVKLEPSKSGKKLTIKGKKTA